MVDHWKYLISALIVNIKTINRKFWKKNVIMSFWIVRKTFSLQIIINQWNWFLINFLFDFCGAEGNSQNIRFLHLHDFMIRRLHNTPIWTYKFMDNHGVHVGTSVFVSSRSYKAITLQFRHTVLELWIAKHSLR